MMSVDNIEDESLLTRATVNNPQPPSQADDDPSSSSKYTPRMSSTYAVPSSAELDTSLPNL